MTGGVAAGSAGADGARVATRTAHTVTKGDPFIHTQDKVCSVPVIDLGVPSKEV